MSILNQIGGGGTIFTGDVERKNTREKKWQKNRASRRLDGKLPRAQKEESNEGADL